MIPVIFSTITGNALKIANVAKANINDSVGPYNIFYVNDEVIDKFDTFVLVYWCNRGTADDETIKLVKRMKNKKIVIMGTLGADANSKHAEMVKANVEALVKENNELLGNFLCRGSIDINRTKRRTLIPEGQVGHLSIERFEKQKESLPHPNQDDLDNAKAFILDLFK